MIAYAAFLRGVNLGKRTVRSADLKSAFVSMGFADARTLIASGNVLFSAEPAPDLESRIEAGLQAAFGFEIGTILRTIEALRAMVALDPFAAVPPQDDTKRYVTFFREPIARTLPMPMGIPGDFEVLRVTEGEIFAAGWKQPDGRYGPGFDQIEKFFPKRTLVTTRNWNTIIKAAQ